jgi:hypothetical protein
MTVGCVHLLYNNAGNSISSQLGSSSTSTVRKRQTLRPIHHVQNHTCRVTFFQTSVLGQHSSLRPHWLQPTSQQPHHTATSPHSNLTSQHPHPTATTTHSTLNTQHPHSTFNPQHPHPTAPSPHSNFTV